MTILGRDVWKEARLRLTPRHGGIIARISAAADRIRRSKVATTFIARVAAALAASLVWAALGQCRLVRHDRG